MEYIVLENAITGCQELVSTAGVESATIGCVWKSTDAYVCITDCNDCALGMVNGSATQLGYNASASNSSTAIGLSAVSCCTSTAIGNGACAIGDNEIHIKGGSAEVISKCNCINMSNGGSTVIDVSDTALNACSEANIYLNVACGCIDIKGCSAVAVIDDSAVIVGNSATGLSCSVAIGANATTAACSTAIGYCACASNGSVAIGNGATATCGIDIRGANSRVTSDCNGNVYVGLCNASSNALHSDNIFGSYNTVGNVDAPNNVIVGVGNSINCDANDAILIGDANEINVCATNVIAIGMEIGSAYDTYASSIGDNDVILGNASAYNKFCGSNGYLYRGECLMTGRILECAACLPATCSQLILYYVP